MNGQIPPSTDSVYGTLSSATWVPKLGGGRGGERGLWRGWGEEAVVVEVRAMAGGFGRRLVEQPATWGRLPCLGARTHTHPGSSQAHPWHIPGRLCSDLPNLFAPSAIQ